LVGALLGAGLFVGLSLGADDGKKLPEGAVLGSPHSTLVGSQGISNRYAQKFSPISLKSSTSHASHSSGLKDASMYTTTVTPVAPAKHSPTKSSESPNSTLPFTTHVGDSNVSS
jgi:hypothetical protein